MRLLIIGATGQVGCELTLLALAEGHQVSVLVRSPQKLSAELKSRVTVFTMSGLTDESALGKALVDQEAVLSTIGPWLFYPYPNDSPIAQGFAVLTKKMQEAGVKRLIVQSTVSDVDPADRQGFIAWLLPWLVWIFSHNAWQEIIHMGEAVRGGPADIDWTVVRVAKVVNGEGGQVGAGMLGERPDQKHFVKRKHIARFFLDSLKDDRWVRKQPYIWSQDWWI